MQRGLAPSLLPKTFDGELMHAGELVKSGSDAVAQQLDNPESGFGMMAQEPEKVRARDEPCLAGEGRNGSFLIIFS